MTPGKTGWSGGGALFERLIRGASDCIQVVDLDGRYLFANPATLNALGLEDMSPLVGRRFVSNWPVKEQEALLRTLAICAAGSPARVTIRPPIGSAASGTWDLQFSPLTGPDDKVEALMVVGRDVTELTPDAAQAEAREEQLQSNATVLRAAGRLAGVGGFVVNYKTGRMYFSEELREITGWPNQSDFTREEAASIIRAEDRDRIFGILAEAERTRGLVKYEHEIDLADGGSKWLRAFGEPAFEGDQLVGLRGAVQDITREKEATIQLEASERFVRAIIDAMGSGLCVLDAAGKIVSVNEAWRKTSNARGFSDATHGIGADFLDSCRPGLGPPRNIRPALRELLAGARVSVFCEYPLHSPSAKGWFTLSAYPLPGPGPGRAVVITHSITRIKRAEQRLRRANRTQRAATPAARAASDAKSAFLATMSHEIRTPLNGVLGMAQAMANDPLPPVQRERLNVVREAGEALLVLLNDLLDLSKIEAGKLLLEDGIVDIARIAAVAKAAFEALAHEKNLRFTLDVAPEALGAWRGDPARVRQVLYNLISNAVKFTDQGEVRVTVARSDEHLVLSVADTGAGIAPAARARLFSKFEQADASMTRRFGGTGLGLAICRELVTIMGGEIEVESILGQGATFTVRLPLQRAPLQADLRPEAAPLAVSSAAGLRVLAAEDNVMNQLVLRTLLMQVGIEPRMVANGEEAVEAWERANWDLILMDVQMPVMDGPTATRAIREAEQAGGRPRTPIIALTANAMAHHAEEYTAAGMDAVASKPINLPVLLATIEAVLEDRDRPATEADRLAG